MATVEFTNIINDICIRSLRLARTKKKSKNHKKWFDANCLSLRKRLNLLSNKKHKNPLDSGHTVRKNFKKLIKCKKSKFFKSQVENLTQNKDDQKFWTYLKSLKEEQNVPSNDQGFPVDNLLKHFKQLHSHPNLSSLPSGPTSFKEDFSNLEQTKDIHNVLDNPITLSEIKKKHGENTGTKKGPWT